MFRKFPEAKPVPCPFKSAPFTVSYNRGSGDCNNPPSKAESCTDDSRLVLKYQSCPDMLSTESNGNFWCFAIFKFLTILIPQWKNSCVLQPGKKVPRVTCWEEFHNLTGDL